MNKGRIGSKLVACGLVLVGAARAQTVQAVPKLDVTRFSTTWYEIARYPWKKEKKCVRDGLQLYANGEKDGRMAEVTSCVYPNGFANVNNITLHFADKKVMDGRLQTQFLLFFHRKQWVLALDDDYGWAVIGNPNHKQLWVLSSKPVLSDDALATAKARAQAMGFDLGKLMAVPQIK